jgi:hypothetical protein
MSETRTLRERQAAGQVLADRTRQKQADYSAAMLGITAAIALYPTTASAFYGCVPSELDGAESEGAAAAYVASGNTIVAYNLGSKVPPIGTPVICHSVGGRWCFRYDG